MKLLFPQNPMMRKLPEPSFEDEFDAAKAIGFECMLFNEDALVDGDGDVDTALRQLPAGTGDVLYRGWILSEERYRLFEHGLTARGYALVSTASQYAAVTYFPNYYPQIREYSPAAVWTDTPDTFAAFSASRKLGDGPFVLKDHVKSAKHNWLDACFVPKGAGREAFELVAENLKKEQGKSFFRGFVVREFVPLRVVRDGPKEYPRCEEYRLFFWRGRLMSVSHYHEEPEEPIACEEFVAVAQRFDAPFFSMDIARTVAGKWLIVDTGAGECTRLPPNLKPDDFYRRLLEIVGRFTSQ